MLRKSQKRHIRNKTIMRTGPCRRNDFFDHNGQKVDPNSQCISLISEIKFRKIETPAERNLFPDRKYYF